MVRILALIPAFNEEESIPSLVSLVREHLPGADILVVNDGSSDDTSAAARREPGVRVLDLPFNMGIGAAVLSGFTFFLENKYDILVRLDGDGQHPPEMAGRLIEPVAGNQLDAAIGSRYLDDEAAYSSVLRKLGIKFLNIVTLAILHRRMTDSTSGFRAYNRRAIELLSRDFPFDFPEPEEIFLLTKHGFRVGEVPVQMKARETGETSIGMLRTYYFLFKIVVTIFVKYAIGGVRR